MKKKTTGGNWAVRIVCLLWRVRTFVVVSLVALSATSTFVYVISIDYLEHRKERAKAMEIAHKNIKNTEEEVVRLLTKTTPIWKRGEPISNDLLVKLDIAIIELYSAIEGLNNATDNMSRASRGFRDAVATLRISFVSYQHDEKTVRAMHSALKIFAKERDSFHTVVERQLEDYNKSVIGLL